MIFRIRLLPKINIDAFEGEKLLTLPHILLVPFTSRIYLNTVGTIPGEGNSGLNSYAKVSSTVMYRYTGRVLASTVRREHTPFKLFQTLDYRIYISILASVITMSLEMAISRTSIKTFVSNFWSYLSVILSDTYSIRNVVKSTADRLMTGVWLMSCTVLLAAFSGLLRDLMIQPNPISWIDSWDDLAEWKHLCIYTTYASEVNFYISYFSNESIAQNFAKRMKLLNNDELYKDFKRWDTDIDYQGIKDGTAALVGDLFYIDTLKQNLVSRYGMIENLDFHISELDDIASQPSFIVTNGLTFNDSMTSKLNQV